MLTTDCIEWKFAKTEAGYPVKRFNGKNQYVHRLVAQKKYGNIKNKVVRHMCDNPACINPHHLLIGTQKDNMRDASERNRIYKGGPNNPHRECKLTKEQVKELLTQGKDGRTYAEIGKQYGVNATTVRSILIGKAWKGIVDASRKL